MKIKYILKVFRFNSLKTLFKIAKQVSFKANRSTFIILIDMIYCSFKYGSSFHDYQEFEFYLLNKNERKTYLTRSKNNMIIKIYNNKDYYYIFDDKFVFNDKFKKYLRRDTLNLNVASKEEYFKFLKGKTKIIAKPHDGEGGKGICIYNLKEIDHDKLYEILINNKTLLLEDVIIQNKELNKLYDGSVNSLRMFTFQKDGKAYFLHAVLKIGNGGVVDNFSSGGMYAFVNDEGIVITSAIDANDDEYKIHPLTNTPILGFKIPYFKEAISMVKKASLEVKEIGYVGWDVAITLDGPVLIEGNCYPGIFQIRPSSSKDKIGLLPKYEKAMGIKIK